ncbi:EAL domain-containing protein [Aureimonas populi]|uniref:EAL domain-containing protein n=1 Tax=Aureimonas populi TaxID=1701758 RepID=A0ABW5CKQ4_9HYPH|nr:EAL domain-containing protein [Aureimonas populi]
MAARRRERRRIDAVKALGVMDDPTSRVAYDRIARLAQRIFGTEIVLITFMDGERQWFKSHLGTRMEENRPEESFCVHAIDNRATLVVEDTQEDERFRDLDPLDGAPLPRFYAGAPIITHDGHAIGTVCILDSAPRSFGEADRLALEDLASLVLTQVKMDREIGFLDPMTRLPNRLKLLLDMQAVARRDPDARRLLVLVDLMSTRDIDEAIGALGLDFFNEQVRHAAEMAVKVLPGTVVYHVGAAYLALLLESIGDPAPLLSSVLGELRAPMPSAAGIPVALRPCAGLREVGLVEMASPDILRTVLAAARQAREAETGLAWYDAGKDEAHRRSFSLLSDFPAALRAEDQLRLVYQPRIDLATGRCHSVEALLRWNHPVMGAIPPSQFFPLVEKTGLIREVTQFVLRHAAGQVAAWEKEGLRLVCSVNVSVRNLLEEDFVERLEAVLAAAGVDPGRIEVEIVEDIDLDGSQTAVQRLRDIRALGVSVAIDDFGAGYSNISYLLALPASTLKIDRSLIAGMLSERMADITVSAMIDLGHRLGYRVVAEGVEDAETYALLEKRGCDEVQGYLIAKPLEVGAVRARIEAGLAPASSSPVPG